MYKRCIVHIIAPIKRSSNMPIKPPLRPNISNGCACLCCFQLRWVCICCYEESTLLLLLLFFIVICPPSVHKHRHPYFEFSVIINVESMYSVMNCLNLHHLSKSAQFLCRVFLFQFSPHFDRFDMKYFRRPLRPRLRGREIRQSKATTTTTVHIQFGT